MDLFDIALYFGYVLLASGSVIIIVIPLFNSLKDIKKTYRTGLAMLIVAGVFLISFFLSGSENNSDVYIKFNVDATGSQLIGAALLTVYLLFGGAFLTIVFTEIRRLF